jgi:glycosyltransferase involved in cell wall biosynthesis
MINSKNRVLIIGTSANTRGGITSVINAHKEGNQWDEFNCKWLETHIDKSLPFKIIYFFKALIQYLFIVFRYDLIHIHLSEPVSAIRKLPFLCIAKLLRKKTIIHFHSFSPETTIESRYTGTYGFIFRNATAIVVLSEFWKQAIESKYILSNKVYVIYNPCAIPDYTQKFDKKKHILYAGTINNRKGYNDLISAFASIAKRNPDWKLVFAGNGDIEKAKELANNQLEFLGWVHGQEKSKAFQEASVFCLPSYAEGFPMAVLDAWAYGVPVVTTPVGGLPDIIKDGVNALVFNPGDIKVLSEQLQKIIENDKLRELIKNESLQLSENDFNRSKITNQLHDLYMNILHA